MARKSIEKNIAYDDIRKKYYVSLNFGVDEYGKQRKATKTFETLADARRALKEHSADIIRGTTVLPNKQTVADWLDYWMKNIIVPNREKTTVYGYQQIIDNHLLPYFGKTKLQDLAPRKVQQYYTLCLNKKNLSASSVKKHHDLLKSALKVAVQQDYLYQNPLDKVEPPRVKQVEKEVYSPEQLQNLFELVEGHRLEIVVKLAGYLGLRRGEICELRWSHVDYNKKLLTIKDTRTMAGSDVIEKDTKNSSSTRVLYLTDELLELLRLEQKNQTAQKVLLGEAYYDSNYIVVWPDGKSYRPNYISELFTDFIKEHNLPKIVLHGLRHTFATVANSMGIPLFDIGKALGHSTPMVTGKIYTHLLDRTHEDTMKKVAERINQNE